MTAAALIREMATPEHRSAARELATFLALFTKPAFDALVAGFRRDLRTREAVAVAIAAVGAVEPHDLPEVAAALLVRMPGPRAGWPEAPILEDADSLLADAELWAAAAWPQERRAWALACLAAMDSAEREAVLRAIARVT